MSHDLADDAAQEAALRAWRRRGTCRTPEAPLAWVRQIARNETYRLLGSARPEELLSSSELESLATFCPTDDVPERIDVARALQELTPADRLLVALRYRADLAQPQIAELLAVPEGTVKVRLHRIRRKLAPALRTWAPDARSSARRDGPRPRQVELTD